MGCHGLALQPAFLAQPIPLQRLGNTREFSSAPAVRPRGGTADLYPISAGAKLCMASEREALRLKGLAIGTFCILAADVAQAGSLQVAGTPVTLRSGR